ncbi:hypothetical protein F511_27355 [Dorcoceras hygrometricum]|uniref:Uncharacterized protein n=1 Tax=Dorcoceras hygrometricum TaxID=472368 RepID=A0A2Z7CCS5_9LAMI|nr:hypothetical protein F511_27355 [Dorcoceras hygrometricum]
MSAERSSASLYASPDENTLFLDVQQEAPLFSHRKPTRIFGSIFYCLLLASFYYFNVARFGHVIQSRVIF